MMSQPKVSVIIPVYNAEPYIEKCVRTLFGQTLDDMEYIFVDDCSPDNSIEILQRVLEEYPHRKNQVKIIRHNTNKGVSQARQNGLDASTGEYVIHCDPDDWVELNMYESLYNRAKDTDADLVICDFFYANNMKSPISQKLEGYSSIEVLEGITSRSKNHIHGALWNKLLKSTIAKKIEFPQGVQYCEDVNYWCQILKYPHKIKYLPQAFYIYNYKPGSLCTVKSRNDINLDIQHIKMLENNFLTGDNERYDACIKSFIIGIIFFRIFCSNLITSKEYYKALSNYGDYLKYYYSDKLIRGSLRLSFYGHYRLAYSMYGILRKPYTFLLLFKKYI